VLVVGPGRPYKFQSTPPRRERPRWVSTPGHYRRISIHAPAKGATFHTGGFGHAGTDFNPRPREGSDTPNRTRSSEAQRISIHAPAKGATLRYPHRFCTHGYFNPRPREGSDFVFCHVIDGFGYFNPRPREGSDFTEDSCCKLLVEFQSTPPRRERRSALLF